jgi:hypothetical protein
MEMIRMRMPLRPLAALQAGGAIHDAALLIFLVLSQLAVFSHLAAFFFAHGRHHEVATIELTELKPLREWNAQPHLDR